VQTLIWTTSLWPLSAVAHESQTLPDGVNLCATANDDSEFDGSMDELAAKVKQVLEENEPGITVVECIPKPPSKEDPLPKPDPEKN
jgi:hypothetical protein